MENIVEEKIDEKTDEKKEEIVEEKEDDKYPPNRSYSIYIGHLNRNISKDDITEKFSRYGKIVKIFLQPTNNVY